MEVRQNAPAGPYAVQWQAPSSAAAAISLDGNTSQMDGGEENPSLPPPKRLKREFPQDPLVSEVDGLMLHLSPSCASGYKGVYVTKSGRYEARQSIGEHLGTHGTALEAALVYAHHLLSREQA